MTVDIKLSNAYTIVQVNEYMSWDSLRATFIDKS